MLAASLPDALAAWGTFAGQHASGFGVICVMDSATYDENLQIQVPAGFTLAMVAADWPVAAAGQRTPGTLAPSGRWPTLTGNIDITGTADPDSENPGTLILDGLRTSGTMTVNDGHLGRLALSHCTVVPWTDLGLDRLPLPTTVARLVVLDGQCGLEADRCILGALRSPAETRVKLSRCVLDATRDTFVAFAAPDGTEAGAALTMINCTVVGKVRTSMLELASNSLFIARLADPDPDWSAPIRSERRQHGCVRFCWLPEGARVPRRYRCQPDLALERRAAELGLDTVEQLPGDERQRVVLRMMPMLRSLRYGDPSYAQLGRRSLPEIREGADDGSEMGVFHDLYAPHREGNLKIRLDEYLRFGLEAGVFFET